MAPQGSQPTPGAATLPPAETEPTPKDARPAPVQKMPRRASAIEDDQQKSTLGRTAKPRPAPPQPAVAETRSELLLEVPAIAPSKPHVAANPQPVAPGRLVVKLRHRINSGTLTLLVDGRPVLTGDFAKKKLSITKVSEWEPVKVSAGEHSVTAKVLGGKGKQYVADPLNVRVPPAGTVSLTIAIQEDHLELLRE